MNLKDLKQKLQSTIESRLTPLINSDYVYWDLPYHVNIGDTLIWQGTLDFLKDKPYKMLDSGNSVTADFSKVSENTIILLHGGGNFGDIYGSSQRFRKEVVNKFPNNKIIILPQTIYFKDKFVEEQDFKFFAKHKKLYLCTRDKPSYDLACKFLSSEKVLFLPDMAFCIKDDVFIKNKSTGRKLLMDRVDVEAVGVDKRYIEKTDVKLDWPSFEKEPFYCLVLRYLNGLNRRVNKKNNKAFFSKLINFYALNVVRPSLIETGVSFINQFDIVYTTRLHGCILSLLLDKKIILLDNSYGKNKAFYDAWLKESENIEVESC